MFKSVRLISPEDTRLPRSFNDRASHINKTDKSSGNNMPASRDYSSSETTVEQKINASDNSSRNIAIFPNPLMSVNNVDNFDAHTWQKNTILIEGDSRINGINEKGTSTNFISVKTRCFTCEYQQFAKRNIISDLL